MKCEEVKQRKRGVASAGWTWWLGNGGLFVRFLVCSEALRRWSCLWSALGGKRDTFTNENLLYRCKFPLQKEPARESATVKSYKIVLKWFQGIHGFYIYSLSCCFLVTLKTVFLFPKMVLFFTSHLPVLQLKCYIFMTINVKLLCIFFFFKKQD